jgi:hypothetical protein
MRRNFDPKVLKWSKMEIGLTLRYINQGAQYESTIIFYLLKFIMLSIKVKSELDILASERKTTFTFLELKRVLKNATPKR